MNQSFIKFIAIFLGVLIILSFIAIIYGSYLKLANKDNDILKIYDLGITHTENVHSTKSMGDNIIIFQINFKSSSNSDNDKISRFLLYDIDQNKVIREIRN